MLDLQPCVHLQEIKVPRPVHDEFHRARTGIAHRTGQRAGLRAHRSPRRLIQKRRGRLLDHLLVAPLDAAFALMQINAVAMAIGQHLNFDMPRLCHELFDEDAVVAKAGRRLALRRTKALPRLGVVPGDPHALAAPPRTGLDHHRITDLRRDPQRLLRVPDDPHVPRHGRNPRSHRQLLGGDLVPHRLDRPRGRPDKDHARRFQRRRKAAVLAQKSIARMHSLGPRGLHRRHDPVDHDIALRSGRWADMHRLVRHPDMQRTPVGIGIDRDRRNPHPARRLDHAAGYFAPIGNQDLLEHLPPFRPPSAGRAKEKATRGMPRMA